MLVEKIHMSDIIGERMDVQFRMGIDKIFHSLMDMPTRIRPLGEIVGFSRESWDQKSLFDDKFPYIEIGSIDTLTGSIKDVNWVSVKDVPSRAKKIVRKNDILISTTRPNRGAICIYKNESISIASSGFSVIREISDEVLREFLFIVLRLPISLEQMMQRSSGGNYPAIVESELKKLMLPIPPIEKQREIVSIYNSALEKRKRKHIEAQRLLDGIDDYLSEVLQIKTNQEILSDDFSIYRNLSAIIGKRLDVSFYKNRYEMISSKYPNAQLSKIVELDPTISFIRYDKDMQISFLPMECIDEQYGEIAEYRVTTISQTKGYTRFEDGDLLWAKIAPCMQNGKSAIARNLKNGIGCGSTEFFVMRPKDTNVMIDYVYLLMRHHEVLNAAQSVFGGSAGQQRVSSQYMKSIMLPVPDLSDQKAIVEEVSKRKRRAKRLQSEGNALLGEITQRIVKLIF